MLHCAPHQTQDHPRPARRAGQRRLYRWCMAAGLAVSLWSSVQAQGLPPEVDAALARAKIPREAMAVLLVDAQGQGSPRVSHRANVAMNPASTIKLVTTFAALDLLGPATPGPHPFTWMVRCAMAPCMAT